MKKSNSLYNINDKFKDELKFISMKNVLHFPTKQIKSNILLDCFLKDKYLKNYKKPKKSEYTIILNQKKKELNNISKISPIHSFMNYNQIFKEKEKEKLIKNKNNHSFLNPTSSNLENIDKGYNLEITDSDISSYYDYNSKVGLNAPLSFKELSNYSSDIESNNNLENIINKNGNELPIIKSKIINNINNNKIKDYNKNKILYNYTKTQNKKNKSYKELNKIKTNIYNDNNNISKIKINNNNYIENKNYKNNKNNNTNYILNNSYNINDKNNQKKNKKNTKNNIIIINKSFDDNIDINNKKNDDNIFSNILLSLKVDKNKNKNKKIKNISCNNINSKHYKNNLNNINDTNNINNLNDINKINKINNININNTNKTNNINNKNNINYINILNDISNINNNNIKNNKIINNENEEKRNSKIIIKNTEESIISSGNISIDFNNINSSTSTKKNKSISNSYYLTKKFITNKNNHFKINIKKEPPSLIQGKKNKNTKTTNNNNISKSPINSLTGRTKDITNRTINKQQNIIINIKQNFASHQNIANSKLIKRNKSTINNKNNKSTDSGYRCRKYIEVNDCIDKINPGMVIYKRDLLLKEQKEKKLEDMRKRKIEVEMSEMQGVPKINDNSKKIAKNNIPIYKRVNEIENIKKVNTEKIKELIIKEKDITANTINDKCAKNIFDKDNFNKWLLLNENWNLKKNIKMEKLKNTINQEKMESEDFQFKPQINKNSEKIFYNNYIYSQYPVIERMSKAKEHKEASIKKIQDEELLSFRPDVNKDYQIRNKYYEFMGEDQVEIYNDLKEKIKNEEKKI